MAGKYLAVEVVTRSSGSPDHRKRVDRSCQLVVMSDNQVIVEWEFPRDILGDIFAALNAKWIARCMSVATPWRDVVKERRDLEKKLALERAWRGGEVQPVVHDLSRGLTTPEQCHSATMLGNKLALCLRTHEIIRVYDMGTWEMVAEIFKYARDLAFLDEGYLFGNTGSTILGWNLGIHNGLVFEKIFDEDDSDLSSTAIACVGNHVVVGRRSGLIKSWKRGSWSSSGENLLGHTGQIRSLDSARKGKLLVSFCFDKTIRVWDILSSECLNVFATSEYGAYLNSICSFESRDAIAIEFSRSVWQHDIPRIILIGLQSGDILCEAKDRNQDVHAPMYAHECRVACVYGNREVKIWDLEEGPECIRTFRFQLSRQRNAWITKDRLFVLDTGGKISVYNFLGL